MDEAEKIERLKSMLDDAKTLLTSDDPLFEHYLPAVLVALQALLKAKGPHNVDFSRHLVEYE